MMSRIKEESLRLAALACMMACATLLTVVDGGHAAKVTNLAQVHAEEDAFLNYDFLSESHSKNNVDWGISLLFWNNSSVNNVKSESSIAFPSTGSTMRAYINNGAGWKWDTDKGRKQRFCPVIGDSVHFRIYGPPKDSFYNERWGFYNIASVHIDHNECNFVGVWFGMSEKAEGIVADLFADMYGDSRVWENVLDFKNSHLTEDEGSHHWESNGLATKIQMPEIEVASPS